MASSTPVVYDLGSSSLREAHLGLAHGSNHRHLSHVAAERSALLQAVAERSAMLEGHRVRPIAWRRIVAALLKPA